MQERLQKVFRKVFNNNNLIITLQTSANDIKMWDSITHMELISEIEVEFNIVFSFDQVMQFNNVGDMLMTIEKLSQNHK